MRAYGESTLDDLRQSFEKHDYDIRKLIVEIMVASSFAGRQDALVQASETPAADVETTTGDTTVLSAGRVQVDFWDPEAGYYLNGTYYGAKNLLAVGVAGQVQGSDKTAVSVDFLLEKKVAGGGAVSVEAEWAKYSSLGGYDGHYAESQGGYVLGAYLFPKMVGKGKMQLLGKFAKATFEDGVRAVDVDSAVIPGPAPQAGRARESQAGCPETLKDLTSRGSISHFARRFVP